MSDRIETGERIAIIGGGAAGFFTAITAAEANPDAQVTVFENGSSCLRKVKVSGGGRCNVTHSCFDPEQLAEQYPRGSRELRGAFYQWQPQDTIEWFNDKGVSLKTEPDGRMFPESDDSQTIIDCFESSARESGVRVLTGTGVRNLLKCPDGSFELELDHGNRVPADKVCLCSGSLKNSPLEQIVKSFGHNLEALAPSLFAFNISDKRLDGLSGIAVQNAFVRVLPKGKPQMGPVLITHRGLSGPAILRLSAWEARILQDLRYSFDISINWLGDVSVDQLHEQIADFRRIHGKALVRNRSIGELPRRLWERLVTCCAIGPDTPWAQLPRAGEDKLARELLDGRYKVRGKTTNKEEFVTCGGIRLKEVDFRTMESRLVPGLFFAGECLDIDGITGGYNFQAAWTTGRIAGQTMAG